jgi:hypothetical protein
MLSLKNGEMTMMRRCCGLLLLLGALCVTQVHTDDDFCINYDLETYDQWPPYTQCLEKTE